MLKRLLLAFVTLFASQHTCAIENQIIHELHQEFATIAQGYQSLLNEASEEDVNFDERKKFILFTENIEPLLKKLRDRMRTIKYYDLSEDDRLSLKFLRHTLAHYGYRSQSV